MWPRPLRRARHRRATAAPTHTRTTLRLTAETRVTISVSCERAWYVIDITTGARLDSADHGHTLTLPTGQEVVVTGHDRPWTLTWQDPEPASGTTDSGGALTLKGWVDSSTTITLSHHLDLPPGTSLTAVGVRQQLLDDQAREHARAWVARLARHGAATIGNA